MNQLVSQARARLHEKYGVGLRMQHWPKLLIGYIADIVTQLSGKSLLIISLKVQKFIAQTKFLTNKTNLECFRDPSYQLEGIELTLECQFITPDPARQIFNTE